MMAFMNANYPSGTNERKRNPIKMYMIFDHRSDLSVLSDSNVSCVDRGSHRRKFQILTVPPNSEMVLSHSMVNTEIIFGADSLK